VTVPVAWLASERISSTPTTALSASSCSTRISRSISTGVAPGQLVVTVRTGTSMLGVSWIGRSGIESRPKRSTKIAPTSTETGRAMASSTTFTAGG
jgi:hypothetical protein